jgi:hypothetical protein
LDSHWDQIEREREIGMSDQSSECVCERMNLYRRERFPEIEEGRKEERID